MPGSLRDAAHVDVDRQDVAAEGEAGDRIGGVAADARQLGQVVRPAVRRDLLRGAVQRERAPVVAEALPLADHVAGRGGRERLDGRPALEPALPARHDALHLRLLRHDFRDQDRVRIPGLPPGQIAPVFPEPGQKQLLHAAEPRGAANARRREKGPCEAPCESVPAAPGPAGAAGIPIPGLWRSRFAPWTATGTCRGSFTEYAIARTDRLAAKPDNVSFEQAAATPISGYAALQAVRDHGKVKAGQRILIIGAGGGVGTFAVQIAKADGAEVTGVCGPAKTELVRSMAPTT